MADEIMAELNEASKEALAEELEARKEDAHTIAALRAQITTRDRFLSELRAENEAQKQALSDQLTARKHNEAEIARLKEIYSEQVQRADKYFIDSQRLRAALEKIVGFSEPGFMHAALEIARAALANIREGKE